MLDRDVIRCSTCGRLYAARVLRDRVLQDRVEYIDVTRMSDTVGTSSPHACPDNQIRYQLAPTT